VFSQELVERGVGRAILRLGKQLITLSPVFEIFSTQIYTHSILSNLTFGGARYIATGRGFATTRISFNILLSRFAGPSIYFGMRTLLMLIYVTLTIWSWFLTYFWVSVLSLAIAPFLFNPHQFSFSDFIIDYRYGFSLLSMQSLLMPFSSRAVNSCGGCLAEIRAHTAIRGLDTAVSRGL
jgi:1,3-beta-glucan synthase